MPAEATPPPNPPAIKAGVFLSYVGIGVLVYFGCLHDWDHKKSRR